MIDEPRASKAGEDPTRVTGENPSSYPSEPPAATSSFLPDDVLGDRYRVIERLGKGGMGEVFLAEHIAIGRPVAIKTLSGDFHERPELARRFIQEARTASQIRHRNVVDITDFGYTDRGTPFFVMELLEGEDLKAILRRERTLPWPHVVAIVTQVCAALAAAHARGVVHRDMKPDNVFVVRDGDEELIKVLDFGIAKITAGEEVGEATRTGVLLGTPHYMSPEQAQDDQLDPRSDVYAVGVLLFRMTTGRLPFRGKSFMKVLSQQINAAPPSPLEFAPPGLLNAEREAIILRCLAKNPEDRFGSAEELAAALRASLAGEVPAGGAAIAGTGAFASVAAGALGGANATGAATPPPAGIDDAGPGLESAAPPRRRGLVLGLAAAAGVILVALAFVVAGEDDTEPAPPASAASDDVPKDIPEKTPDAVAATPPPGADKAPTTGAAEAPEPEPEPEPAPPPETKTKRGGGKAKKAGTTAKVEPRDALTSADLSAAAASVRGALAGCTGGLPGMVIKVDLKVSAAGKVTSATAHKPQRGSALGRCVEEAAAKAKFPPLRSPQEVTVPFRLP